MGMVVRHWQVQLSAIAWNAPVAAGGSPLLDMPWLPKFGSLLQNVDTLLYEKSITIPQGPGTIGTCAGWGLPSLRRPVDLQTVGDVIVLCFGISQSPGQWHVYHRKKLPHTAKQKLLLKLKKVGIESGAFTAVPVDFDIKMSRHTGKLRLRLLQQLEKFRRSIIERLIRTDTQQDRRMTVLGQGYSGLFWFHGCRVVLQ